MNISIGKDKLSLPSGTVASYEFLDGTITSTDDYNALKKKVIDGQVPNSQEQLTNLKKEDGMAEAKDLSKTGLSDDPYSSNVKYPVNSVNEQVHAFGHVDYGNRAMGSFGTINAGAHVWVKFMQGDPNYPVIIGSIRGAKDFEGIYNVASETPDLPTSSKDSYENGTETGEESEIYRNKWIMNQRGGYLQIVSTTGREMVTVGHQNGSHLELNRYGANHYINGKEQTHIRGDLFNTVKGNRNTFAFGDKDDVVFGDVYRKIGNVREWRKHFTAIKDKLVPIHEKKRLFDLKRAEFFDVLEQSSNQAQSGSFVECPLCSGDLEWNTLDNGKIVKKSQPTEFCPSCHNTGLSVSTQDGKWDMDSDKESIPDDECSATTAIGNEEKMLGGSAHPAGGNDITYVSKDKIDIIGLEFNDLCAYRKDRKGKLVPYALNLAENGDGIFPDYMDSPLVEKVAVSDFPGGNYTQIIGNKYDLRVGSNGMDIKTTGAIEMGADSTMTIASEETHISSKGETTITGKRLNMTADAISICPRAVERNGKMEQNILLDANVNTCKNSKIRGGQHVEGELFVQHVTAPKETRFARLNSGKLIGYCSGVTSDGAEIIAQPVYSYQVDDAIQYDGIPLNLHDTNNTVREGASLTNGIEPVLAHAPKDEMNYGETVDKFAVKTNTTTSDAKPKGQGEGTDETTWDKLSENETSVNETLNERLNVAESDEIQYELDPQEIS